MIVVKIDQSELSKIEKDLGNFSKKSKYVLKKAINQTAKETRKDLLNAARTKYAVKVGRFNSAAKIKNASIGSLIATIYATGSPLEIKDFRVSPGSYGKKVKVAKGKVYRVGSLVPLQKGTLKAFVAKFKSGHVSVVERVPGKKMKSNQTKDALKKLFSPSVPTMLGNEKMLVGVVEPTIQEQLDKNISLIILEVLGGN
ncbi:hypothetical protein lbkm_0683 [Lachnospiraceae bacterium KM106-2]|nr:hypothetical protein lbkm_0683 [Lachnospiraceae bacterium KM106-2]